MCYLVLGFECTPAMQEQQVKQQQQHSSSNSSDISSSNCHGGVGAIT
jgi:hypothetical protein